MADPTEPHEVQFHVFWGLALTVTDHDPQWAVSSRCMVEFHTRLTESPPDQTLKPSSCCMDMLSELNCLHALQETK